MTHTLLDAFAVPAALGALEELEARLVAHLDRWPDLPDPAAIRYEVALAVQEIAVNIVRHAYAGGPGRIDVEVYAGRAPERLEIHLHDSGAPFDPARVPEPTLDGEQEGGLGLFLARALMDELDYAAGPTGNTWRLVRRLGR